VSEIVVEPEPGATLGLRTQLVRFVVTGGLSAVVDFGLYMLEMHLFGVQRDIAKSISFVAGTTTAYLLNRRWTFRAEPSRARFFAVLALYGVTFALQVGLNAVMYDTFSRYAWKALGAYVIAQGVATVINFVVQRAVIFTL
jgi:putative flippase GtrA